MTLTQQIITVAMVVLGTAVTRFLPFLIFPAGKQTPKYVQYLGKVLPAAVFGLTHKNIFGGGELLTSQINGSYEWMTGSGSEQRLNSYEVGLDLTLAVPRLLALYRPQPPIHQLDKIQSFGRPAQPPQLLQYGTIVNRIHLGMAHQPLLIEFIHPVQAVIHQAAQPHSRIRFDNLTEPCGGKQFQRPVHSHDELYLHARSCHRPPQQF